MLSDHVKTHRFGFFNIKSQRLVCGCRVKTVGPPALIEWTVLKDKLVVEHHAFNAIATGSHRDFAHAEIAFDLIDHPPAAADLHRAALEQRIRRGPAP